ncbi:TonB-dependent receptor [Lunatimonas lonarensis]|uniref:TonB-dependent receptor n=1 Tax=Lunatimonas lonarensis TaxID=1232681 RepID=R7ZSI2_9BACT|nr:TonB-dependent receptor [Lunatimonas lonarensis]EON77070.1 TonB-dependent receptor [Lunatimonas lonarensis]
MKANLLILLLLVLPFYWGQAQESDSIQMDLDPVVVTGTRQEMPLRKVAAAVSIVDRTDLERSGELNVLPALVQRIPGFFLNDRGTTGFGVGPNSGGNISIRGISGSPNSRVLVLIDGQPQYMGIFAHPIADSYMASDIERVEVQRGAASLLYGSNAMGGAINLITRKTHRDGWHGNGSIGYGSYGTLLASAHAAYRSGSFFSMVSLNRNQTEGFRKDAADRFANTAFYWKTGYELNETYRISAELQLSDADYFQPGPISAPLLNDRREFLRGRVATSLQNSHGRTSGALLLYHNFGDHRFETGFESKDQNQGVTFYQNLDLLPKQLVTVGVDYKRFGGTAFNESLPPPARMGLGDAHWITETDVYIHVQQSLGERIHLNAGIRQVANSQFGGATLPGFGASWELRPSTIVKASSAKAFRSPSVVDLFLFPVSNDALRPEELWSHELGLVQELLDQKLSLEANLFYSKGSNLIVVNPMETPPRGQNTGSFRNRGVESQLKFAPNKLTEWIVNYCFLDRPANILFAPRHHITSQAYFSFGNITLLPSVQYLVGLTISPDQTLPEVSYAVANLRVSYQITSNIQAYLSGNNLTDTTYEVEQGYPMQGINVISGIQFKL